MEDLYHDESFRGRISSVTASGKRNWIFALKPSGRLYQYRNYLAWVCLAIFFILPFIYVRGNPLFLINIIDSKFVLFGKIFWPQDFFILALGMIFFIVFIALFTIIYGRLFCGWVCPQTIFMEFVFRKIEWMIEGTPGSQRKLNEGPWTVEKTWKKTLKHFLFITFSFLIAHTFLAYIIGVKAIWQMMRQPFNQNIGMLLGLTVFTLLFYGVFAFVREIVCTTICPYGRLQGVLYDKNTMQISYDYDRGEPRAHYKKTATRIGGDCIDCRKCVIVCPTGIDIRDGVQMDCVGCTACIDACDEVMDKVGFARGLIRYASENEIAEKKPFAFTAKMKAYSAILVLLMCSMGFMIVTRTEIDTHISRVKGQLFQEVDENTLSNLFEAKIINKSLTEKEIELKTEGNTGTVKLVGMPNFHLKAEAVNDFTFFLEIPKSEIKKRSNPITIGVYENGKRIEKINTKFLGPFK
ncbi:MAG TPA: cytochrome c oxidase accessory protein CcoG [Saprospiraceae bacterium]|nr:cytochrome c oxidase accessory protein CcoG [Saprospiraceae bacterium]